MKRKNRLLSLLTALLLAVAMTLHASAASIDNKTDHPHNAYQIFSGTQADDGSKNLAGIEWGSGVANKDALLAALKADDRFKVNSKNIFEDCTTAAEVANALGEWEDDSAVAKAFANVVKAVKAVGSGSELHSEFLYLSGTSVPIAADATTAEMAPGYYLIIDASTKEDIHKGDANNSALLQVTSDITIAEKYNVPTVNKDIIEADGTHVESTDANIGDIINFEIVGTLPDNYDDFNFYRYIFRDTMSHGLELVGEWTLGENGYKHMPINSGVEVKVMQGEEGPIDLTEYANLESTGMHINIAYEMDTNENPKGSLTIQFDDLKKLEEYAKIQFKPGARFVITYSAKVTQFATTGDDGDREQSNRVFLEYTRNPNDTVIPDDVKPTPEDVVEVYTFELDVAKVDSADSTKKLTGAKFVLYRENGNAKEYAQIGMKPGDSIFGDENINSVADINSKVKGWTTNKGEAALLESDKNGAVKIIGLDSGTYYLEEIEAPAGYNKLTEPVKVEIIAELDKSENNPKLIAVSIKIDGKEAQNGDHTYGKVSTDIANAMGSLLPTTGGIGTTLFYVAGGALVVGAACLLLFKRRKGA